MGTGSIRCARLTIIEVNTLCQATKVKSIMFSLLQKGNKRSRFPDYLKFFSLYNFSCCVLTEVLVFSWKHMWNRLLINTVIIRYTSSVSIVNFSQQMLSTIMFPLMWIGAAMLSTVLLHAKQMWWHTTEYNILLCVIVSVMAQWRQMDQV